MGAVIVIPGTMPGLNEIIDEARTNRYKSAEQKETYTRLVAWYAKKAKIPKMVKVSLNITWYEPHKKRNPDNVQAAVKYIWDGLVNAGVLINDGWGQQGETRHIMRVDKLRPRVEIEIKEVDPE